MSVTLPIEDTEPTEGAPPELVGLGTMRGPGQTSLTQQIVEEVMARDFPSVAALGIESYVSRLSRLEYTSGFNVFWLDYSPDLPGYTLAALEPVETKVGADGELVTNIDYKTGSAAAARAEQVRRLIPPGAMRSGE